MLGDLNLNDGEIIARNIVRSRVDANDAKRRSGITQRSCIKRNGRQPGRGVPGQCGVIRLITDIRLGDGTVTLNLVDHERIANVVGDDVRTYSVSFPTICDAPPAVSSRELNA